MVSLMMMRMKLMEKIFGLENGMKIMKIIPMTFYV